MESHRSHCQPAEFFAQSGVHCFKASAVTVSCVYRELAQVTQKSLQLAVDNDRVFDDLWGKDNMPVVLNNPYSESVQVQ